MNRRARRTDAEGPRQLSAPAAFAVRCVSSAAVWSVAGVVSARLRHPMVGFVMGVMAVCLTLLIWAWRPNNPGGN